MRPIPLHPLAWSFALLLISLLGTPSAHAQWGLPWGVGLGGPYAIGGGPTSYETVSAINQRSLQAGQAAFSDRSSGGGPNPNAYYLHARDDAFLDRFDVSTRRGMSGSSYSARPSAPRTPPARPLAQFFNAMGRLVWPANAPVQGELQAQRDDTDQAASAVFQQVRSSGVASITTTNDARYKLLVYGHPALDYLQQHTSQAVTDAFEDFLLALYDSLGQAAIPPAPGIGSR